MRFSSAVRINSALLPFLFASAKNILVLVGDNNQLAFSPSSVAADVGDIVEFQFRSKNHSVTQSSFANPCQILTTPAGLDSGFQFVNPAATLVPQWSITISDVFPLWFFCAQTTHCQEVGMVFSVNANELGSETFAAFQARAMAAASSTSSAVSSPASNAVDSTGTTPFTASGTALTSSTTPSSPDSPVVVKKMNLAGPITGGVVGGLALLAGLGILLYWTRRRRERSDVAVFRSEVLDIEKEPFTLPVPFTAMNGSTQNQRKLADGEKQLSPAQQMGVIRQQIRDLTEQAVARGPGESMPEDLTGQPNSANSQVLDAIRMLRGQMHALEQQFQAIGHTREDELPQYTAGPSS
ncbi:hypothetical protein B0H19DRAFT_923868 [Mycena capillaripes]|nr:hypothetical protein B0H19DRAFT_923868 [Mycena capillaripes]